MIKQMQKVQQSSYNEDHSFSSPQSVAAKEFSFKMFLIAVGGMPSNQYLIKWHDTF